MSPLIIEKGYLRVTQERREITLMTIYLSDFIEQNQLLQIFCYNQQMQGDSNSSEVVLDDFQVLEKDTIKHITSSTISESRKILLITTAKGFVLVDLIKSEYVRFEDNLSPFYVRSPKQDEEGEASSKQKQDGDAKGSCGCQLGSILQSRTEVALVPSFRFDLYNDTSIYIYDYNIKIILSRFNFNLPIVVFSITNNQLIVSNNKRIVLYNYRKSRPQETEQYYLKTYKSDQSADFVKYFDLFCHLCDEQNYRQCECGKYSYSKMEKYMKLFYMRIGFSQNIKSRILYLYDEKLDKTKFFYEQKPYNQNFHFSISQQGKYLSICEDYGRKINVYNLAENCLYTVLYLGRQPKNIVNLNVVTLPNGAEWAIATREKEGALATMHMFKLARTSVTELVPSRYRRKFRLYKQTMRDYDVFQDSHLFINPEFYLSNYKLFIISLLGEYCQIIDFNKSGLHDERIVNDYKSIEEYKADQ